MKQVKVCQVLHGIVGGGSEQVVLNYCSRMPEMEAAAVSAQSQKWETI